VDKMTLLCQKRALEAFDLDPREWGVNLLPFSGSSMNFAICTALVGSSGRIMGLDLPDGDHQTQGYCTEQVSGTSQCLQSIPYTMDPSTGHLDYDALARNANLFKPNMIIIGSNCHPRNLDYTRFREIASRNDSYLMMDITQIGGLVAAKIIPSPFPFCDVITSTTLKSLRGPSAGVIFYRKGIRSTTAGGEKIMYDLQPKMDAVAFSSLQGGPQINTIAAMAVTFAQTKTIGFVEYQRQVLANAQAMAGRLIHHGYSIFTGGTENHLCLLDLRPMGLDVTRVVTLLECFDLVRQEHGSWHVSRNSGSHVSWAEGERFRTRGRFHARRCIAREADQSEGGHDSRGFQTILQERRIVQERGEPVAPPCGEVRQQIPQSGIRQLEMMWSDAL